MKERPILFSGPMVRALPDGSKTQTRRVVKPAGAHHLFQFRGEDEARGADEPTGEWAWCRAEHVVSDHIRCPYGKPSDRLWVRETFFAFGRWETRFSAKKGRDEWHFVDMTLECDRIYQYAADEPDVPVTASRHGGVTPGWWKRPAIHMPRWASRITLGVIGVRVERLQDISEADAAAEGVESLRNEGEYWKNYLESTADCDALICLSARESFRTLWDSLATTGADWAANPWVWVVEFKRVT